MVLFAALVVRVPPQAGVELLPTVIPGGNGSLNATPVRFALPAGFRMVKFKVVVPLSATVAGEKDFEIVGGDTTVTLAVPGVGLLPPWVEVTVTELFLTPEVVPVTATVILQLLFCPTDPLLR